MTVKCKFAVKLKIIGELLYFVFLPCSYALSPMHVNAFALRYSNATCMYLKKLVKRLLDL
mgnify:CR=1 FL=1